MNISNPKRVWIPAVATDIRKTFRAVDAEDDWRSRLDGAREVLRVYANVTKLPTRRA